MQHGKLDQMDAFSYYVAVGSTQQMLTVELMLDYVKHNYRPLACQNYTNGSWTMPNTSTGH
ncbi:hypothetical protein SCLCIDRAFT_32923 [Scleroderma citrinum Foug A]|uniref:Uncharacterized protein n=1 Tax=Scleroderma citrinum Foug A TaxID=1036808 RepID=A0A0C2ZH33_9AGAM|nr:hypothetical protein SCLCIDRAFT_32923 [Scleroderma citrinum Foug A]